MNIWENTVLTDQGRALQTKLLQGQTLKIKRAATGAAKVPVVDLRQQTSVTEGGHDIVIQPSRIEGENTVLPVLLENTGLKEGYDLWQVGFYAEDPDEGEILFCLAQASQAKHVPSASESPGFSITWDFYFHTSNTIPFEVVLDSNGLVNIESYQVHTEEINQLKSRADSLNSELNSINIGMDSVKSQLAKNAQNIENKPDKSRFSDFVIMRKINYNYSCNHNSSVSFTINFPSISGYTFVSGYCCSTNCPVCFCYYFAGTQSSICYFKNYHSSTDSGNRSAEFIGIYVKNI